MFIMNKFIKLSTIFSTVFTVIPLILVYFIKRKYKHWEETNFKDNELKYYYQTIFFNHNNFMRKPHLINKTEHSDKCSYAHVKTILRFIASAEKTISLCCYTITFKEIAWELADAQKRGVQIRIITDKVMTKTTGSSAEFFTRKGIPCKTQDSDQYMMHHKFCLIDETDNEKAKVFFGSLNLTRQAFSANFDAIVLTNDTNIIARFSQEFEELWHRLN